MIPEHIIEKIKDENDIVEVISDTVRLKRSGRNYQGLCPFHNEKTPSFSVSSEKQLFKCFGCGEAGNVITFVMKNRNLSYVEALRYLADRANITIEESKSNKRFNDKKDVLYNVNKEAARFFFGNMNKSNNIGKAYFLNRGIKESTLRKFGLGYSQNSWNSLMNYLKSKGIKEQILLDAGLIIKNDKGNIYDRFRNRVMFPVFDYKGRVIAFGGRVLDDSKPKYLNSPETLVFNKGTNLYGLNFALKEKNTLRTFIIVEGYMDVISLHQYGITNVVASLGTALTVNQARLLKRYADKVIISYDADLAGQMATLRGLEILKNTGFDVRVLTVPNGKDPDEFIRANGKEAFLRLANNSEPLIDYRLKKAKEGINFKDKEMVIKYTRNVTEILANLDSIEKDVYIKKISEETGIKEEAIYDNLNDDIKKVSYKGSNMNTSDDFRQKLYVESAYVKAARSILKMVLENYSLEYIYSNMNPDDFIIEAHKILYKVILESQEMGDLKERFKLIESKCNSVDTTREWVNIKELNLIFEEGQKEELVKDYIYEIKQFKLEETIKEVMRKIKEFESKGMIEETLKYVQKLKELQKELGRG
ncbi:DNA primase [Clostridium hydrogeniformans]|uniref:DNA primase n=1 Tax=Clostridium hydrogeniformans TaxID=349933 RepID=UPI00048197DE